MLYYCLSKLLFRRRPSQFEPMILFVSLKSNKVQLFEVFRQRARNSESRFFKIGWFINFPKSVANRFIRLVIIEAGIVVIVIVTIIAICTPVGLMRVAWMEAILVILLAVAVCISAPIWNTIIPSVASPIHVSHFLLSSWQASCWPFSATYCVGFRYLPFIRLIIEIVVV